MRDSIPLYAIYNNLDKQMAELKKSIIEVATKWLEEHFYKYENCGMTYYSLYKLSEGTTVGDLLHYYTNEESLEYRKFANSTIKHSNCPTIEFKKDKVLVVLYAHPFDPEYQWILEFKSGLYNFEWFTVAEYFNEK